MVACHILLGWTWQHDVDATHRGKRNIYMFTWEGKRIAMKSIPPPFKLTKEGEPKFTSICNQDEFLVESKETKQWFALVVKEEVGPAIEVPEKMKLMLKEFQRIVHDELPDEVPPMRDIRHHMIWSQKQVYPTSHTTSMNSNEWNFKGEGQRATSEETH